MIDMSYYEPFIKPRYKEGYKIIFPFSHWLDRYAPLMRVIMKYFTYEGRYSRLYPYHVRLLMHFTRVKMLHLPYYLYRSIEKMSYVVQRRSYTQKMHSLFHHSLIKMVVLHQLEKNDIPWYVFIAHEILTKPQPHHQPSLPSSSHFPPSTPQSPPTDHASSSTQETYP